MAFLNRFLVDVVTDEEMSDRRLASIASELSEHVHVLGLEPEDGLVNVVDKQATGHTHDGTSRCQVCEYNAYDSRNGDTLVG